MKIISTSKSIIGGDVGIALDKAVKEVNSELSTVDGIITKIECDISVGPSGATVSISVIVNGIEPKRKELIGINEKGFNKENSVKKATDRLNRILSQKSGTITDFFTKTIFSPLPGRVYTTIIAAVNETKLEKVMDTSMRRRRIKQALELFNNDPTAINIAGLAKVFGVSRIIIYKDLEILGLARKQNKA